jgi:hypothetical protein
VPAAQFNPREHRATLGDCDPSLWPKDEKGQPVDPWKEAVMLPMVDPATHEIFTFSSCAVGGVREAKRLTNGYVRQLRAAPKTTDGCAPVVELGTRSYLHDDRKRGKIYNPTLEVVDWVRVSDLLAPPEPGADSEPPPDDGAPEPDIPLR